MSELDVEPTHYYKEGDGKYHAVSVNDTTGEVTDCESGYVFKSFRWADFEEVSCGTMTAKEYEETFGKVDTDNVKSPAPYGQGSIESDGGPTSYYDFQPDWKTWNDLADYKAERQWTEHSFHLGNIGKAIYRWGEKSGATKSYDARKIIYSGLRVLLMLEGKNSVRAYLESLLRDPQFEVIEGEE